MAVLHTVCVYSTVVDAVSQCVGALRAGEHTAQNVCGGNNFLHNTHHVTVVDATDGESGQRIVANRYFGVFGILEENAGLVILVRQTVVTNHTCQTVLTVDVTGVDAVGYDPLGVQTGLALINVTNHSACASGCVTVSLVVVVDLQRANVCGDLTVVDAVIHRPSGEVVTGIVTYPTYETTGNQSQVGDGCVVYAVGEGCSAVNSTCITTGSPVSLDSTIGYAVVEGYGRACNSVCYKTTGVTLGQHSAVGLGHVTGIKLDVSGTALELISTCCNSYNCCGVYVYKLIRCVNRKCNVLKGCGYRYGLLGFNIINHNRFGYNLLNKEREIIGNIIGGCGSYCLKYDGSINFTKLYVDKFDLRARSKHKRHFGKRSCFAVPCYRNGITVTVEHGAGGNGKRGGV